MASSRSSKSARKTPRLLGQRAWISSMMTCLTDRSVSPRFVSINWSDSGVVINRSGGFRSNRWRSAGGVSCSDRDRDWVGWRLSRFGFLENAPKRFLEISRDILVESFKRRYVENPNPARARRHAPEVIEACQERGQGLARPSRRQDQGVLSGRNRGPACCCGGVGFRRSDGTNGQPPGGRGRERQRSWASVVGDLVMESAATASPIVPAAPPLRKSTSKQMYRPSWLLSSALMSYPPSIHDRSSSGGPARRSGAGASRFPEYRPTMGGGDQLPISTTFLEGTYVPGFFAVMLSDGGHGNSAMPSRDYL